MTYCISYSKYVLAINVQTGNHFLDCYLTSIRQPGNKCILIDNDQRSSVFYNIIVLYFLLGHYINFQTDQLYSITLQTKVKLWKCPSKINGYGTIRFLILCTCNYYTSFNIFVVHLPFEILKTQRIKIDYCLYCNMPFVEKELNFLGCLLLGIH